MNEPFQYQCKNCGTPIRSSGFCCYHCRLDYNHSLKEAETLMDMNEERSRKENER